MRTSDKVLQKKLCKSRRYCLAQLAEPRTQNHRRHLITPKKPAVPNISDTPERAAPANPAAEENEPSPPQRIHLDGQAISFEKFPIPEAEVFALTGEAALPTSTVRYIPAAIWTIWRPLHWIKMGTWRPLIHCTMERTIPPFTEFAAL